MGAGSPAPSPAPSSFCCSSPCHYLRLSATPRRGETSPLFVPLLLNRWTGRRAIRAEDATIALGGTKHRAAHRAGVGEQAGKLRHRLQALITTRWASNKRVPRNTNAHATTPRDRRHRLQSIDDKLLLNVPPVCYLPRSQFPLVRAAMPNSVWVIRDCGAHQ